MQNASAVILVQAIVSAVVVAIPTSGPQIACTTRACGHGAYAEP